MYKVFKGKNVLYYYTIFLYDFMNVSQHVKLEQVYLLYAEFQYSVSSQHFKNNVMYSEPLIASFKDSKLLTFTLDIQLFTLLTRIKQNSIEAHQK